MTDHRRAAADKVEMFLGPELTETFSYRSPIALLILCLVLDEGEMDRLRRADDEAAVLGEMLGSPEQLAQRIREALSGSMASTKRLLAERAFLTKEEASAFYDIESVVSNAVPAVWALVEGDP